MAQFLAGMITGTIIVALMAAGALANLDSQIDAATDRVARIEEQYKSCIMVGTYPTKADMLPESDGSHE